MPATHQVRSKFYDDLIHLKHWVLRVTSLVVTPGLLPSFLCLVFVVLEMDRKVVEPSPRYLLADSLLDDIPHLGVPCDLSS